MDIFLAGNDQPQTDNANDHWRAGG